jgi:hypothetical protein
MNTADSPVILTPLGGLKMTYLIMPVQIRAWYSVKGLAQVLR